MDRRHHGGDPHLRPHDAVRLQPRREGPDGGPHPDARQHERAVHASVRRELLLEVHRAEKRREQREQQGERHRTSRMHDECPVQPQACLLVVARTDRLRDERRRRR